MADLRRLIHRVITALVAVFNRNPWTSEKLEFVPRIPAYNEDGLRTVHNQVFLDAPEFRRAYARGVQAAGRDYGIQWRVHVMLWAARTAVGIPGAFVECGTARGFMASAICEDLGWGDRPFYLFDTFTPGDNPRFYAHGSDAVAANFREWPGVQLVVGHVPGTLEEVNIEQVAFLHIDMNHPVPEEAALRCFWPKLSTGAIVVFDDYAYLGYHESHRSADRVATELGFSILSLPTGQGLAIKQR